MMDEPNDGLHYKACMNLQCSDWTWKATMNFQDGYKMDEKKCSWEATYFQDKVNVKDNETCEATRYSQNEKVDINGVCKAATNLQDKKDVNSHGTYEAWTNSWVRNYSSCLVKNVDVAKYVKVVECDKVAQYDKVTEYNKVVVYDLVEKYDIVTKNDNMTEYDMVKLVHEKFNDMMSLAVMNRDGMKVLKKSFEDMAALMVNPAVLFEIYSNMVIYLEKLYKTWQPLCLGVWWLLSPHRGYCLQWLMCLVEFAEGQVFQTIVVIMLLSCWIGIMAISNMNPLRHVATPEHMSRIEKRRKKRVICTMRKQFISLMFICSCSSAAAMEQDAMLQRIISLTEAATRAALSAEQTLSQVQGMTSGAISSSEGLQAASRILKAPDTFNGDDPMQFASWRFQFTSWLTFGNSRYTILLEKAEAMTSSPSIASYDTSEKELAHKLYAVLTSYLRGRCSHIIKAFAKSRDGFAIWYQLMREFEPTSRQRSLALA